MRFRRTKSNNGNGNGNGGPHGHHLACLSCPQEEEVPGFDEKHYQALRKKSPYPPNQPQSSVPWSVVDKLAFIQSTPSEIAAFFGLAYNTLDDRCKVEQGMSLREYRDIRAEGGRSVLRKAQWKRAVEGGQQQTAMLIWLGKQYLDQSEPTQKTEISGKDGGAIKMAAMSDAELVEEANKLLKVIEQEESDGEDRSQRALGPGSG